MTFHALVIAFLLHRSYSTANLKKGVISVDFIQSIQHNKADVVEKAKDGKKKPTFRAPEPVAALSTAPAGDPAASSSETNAYILSVLKIINQRKVYPPEAIDRGEEGRVVVGVSVAASGQVLEVRIEEPSPFVRLNNSALQTVSNIKSFPPLPAGVAAPIHLHIPLVYRVEIN